MTEKLKRIRERFRQWKKSGSGDKTGGKSRGLIVFLVGVLLLVITVPIRQDSDSSRTKDGTVSETANDSTSTSSEEYIEYTEQRLEEILSQIQGAGEVEVMLTLASTAEKVVEKDQETTDETTSETDSQGGSRETTQESRTESTVYSGKSTGGFTDTDDTGETPYVTKELSPQVEGVVVAASGGGSASVRENIIACVQALFGIDTHKIRVVTKISK